MMVVPCFLHGSHLAHKTHVLVDALGAHDVDIFWMSVAGMSASTKIEMRMIWPYMAIMIVAMFVKKRSTVVDRKDILTKKAQRVSPTARN